MRHPAPVIVRQQPRPHDMSVEILLADRGVWSIPVRDLEGFRPSAADPDLSLAEHFDAHPRLWRFERRLAHRVRVSPTL